MSIKNFFKGIRDLIYPDNCIICKRYLSAGSEEGNLCLYCRQTIEFNRPPFCHHCSRHLVETNEQNLCPECLLHHHHFDRAWAAAIYNNTLKELIHLFKYKNKTLLRRDFAGILSAFIHDYNVDIGQFDIVVPIPLHTARLRERGYNQSELLAESLLKEFKIKPSFKNLVRKRHTKNQALLKKKDRWTNIQGAFKIKRPEEFSRKSVLIVDDLLTTGTTLSEAALILKEAGAHKVCALTLAIAL